MTLTKNYSSFDGSYFSSYLLWYFFCTIILNESFLCKCRSLSKENTNGKHILITETSTLKEMKLFFKSKSTKIYLCYNIIICNKLLCYDVVPCPWVLFFNSLYSTIKPNTWAKGAIHFEWINSSDLEMEK